MMRRSFFVRIAAGAFGAGCAAIGLHRLVRDAPAPPLPPPVEGGFLLPEKFRAELEAMCKAAGPNRVWIGRGRKDRFNDPRSWSNAAPPKDGDALLFLQGTELF